MRFIVLLTALALGACVEVRVQDPTIGCSPAIGEYRNKAVVYGDFGPYHTAIQQEVMRGCVGHDVALRYEFLAHQERLEFVDWRGQRYSLHHEGWDESALTAAYGQWLRENAGASRTEWGVNGSYQKEGHYLRNDSEGRSFWDNWSITSNKEGKTGTK